MKLRSHLVRGMLWRSYKFVFFFMQLSIKINVLHFKHFLLYNQVTYPISPFRHYFLGRTLDEKLFHSTKSGGRSRAKSPRVSLRVLSQAWGEAKSGSYLLNKSPMCYKDSSWIKLEIYRGTKNHDLFNKRVFWWRNIEIDVCFISSFTKKIEEWIIFNVF